MFKVVVTAKPKLSGHVGVKLGTHSLGSANFVVPSTGTGVHKFTLSTHAFKHLKKVRHEKVKITASDHNSSGSASTSRTVTLQAPPKTCVVTKRLAAHPSGSDTAVQSLLARLSELAAIRASCVHRHSMPRTPERPAHQCVARDPPPKHHVPRRMPVATRRRPSRGTPAAADQLGRP